MSTFSSEVRMHVAEPRLVYILIDDKALFDRIDAPLTDHGENKDGHVLSKRVGGSSVSEPWVVFQHWLKFTWPRRNPTCPVEAQSS